MGVICFYNIKHYFLVREEEVRFCGILLSTSFTVPCGKRIGTNSASGSNTVTLEHDPLSHIHPGPIAQGAIVPLKSN